MSTAMIFYYERIVIKRIWKGRGRQQVQKKKAEPFLDGRAAQQLKAKS